MEDGVVRDDFLVIGGESNGHALKASLLVNLALRYAKSPSGDRLFREGDFRVLHPGERILVVKVQTCCVADFVCVIHAPTLAMRKSRCFLGGKT